MHNFQLSISWGFSFGLELFRSDASCMMLTIKCNPGSGWSRSVIIVAHVITIGAQYNVVARYNVIAARHNISRNQPPSAFQ